MELFRISPQGNSSTVFTKGNAFFLACDSPYVFYTVRTQRTVSRFDIKTNAQVVILETDVSTYYEALTVDPLLQRLFISGHFGGIISVAYDGARLKEIVPAFKFGRCHGLTVDSANK